MNSIHDISLAFTFTEKNNLIIYFTCFLYILTSQGLNMCPLTSNPCKSVMIIIIADTLIHVTVYLLGTDWVI